MVNFRPQKEDPHRVCLTVGGNRIDYLYDNSTSTCKLITANTHWNSVISTKGAHYMTTDVKYFYLKTPIKDYEYTQITLAYIPDEIISKYNLCAIARNGKVSVEIRKGMYSPPQADLLSHKQLVNHLDGYGYAPIKFTNGLWKHCENQLTFTLAVDDFGVKYVNKSHTNHLISALEYLYEVTKNWTGSLYVGLTLKWKYAKGHIDMSIPG